MSTHMKVPDLGAKKELDILRLNLLQTLFLRLYKVSKVPAQGDVLIDYTAIECTFPGYAGVAVNVWTVPSLVAGRAYSEASNQTFTRGAGGAGDTVFGYFLSTTADASGILIGAQLFDTAQDMTVNGNTFQLLATHTLVSEF